MSGQPPAEFHPNAGNPNDISGESEASIHTLPKQLDVDGCYTFKLRDTLYTFKVQGYDKDHNINVTWLGGSYPNDDDGDDSEWFSATQILYESESQTGYKVGFTPTDCPPELAGGRRRTRRHRTRRHRTRRRRTIRMKKSEYLREHHHLFKVLKNPTRRALNAELRKQQRELRKRGLK